MLSKLASVSIAGFVIVAFIMMALLPLAVIWALNTLFSLGIGYTFANWAATFVLLFVLSNSRNTVKSS